MNPFVYQFRMSNPNSHSSRWRLKFFCACAVKILANFPTAPSVCHSVRLLVMQGNSRLCNDPCSLSATSLVLADGPRGQSPVGGADHAGTFTGLAIGAIDGVAGPCYSWSVA
jgi:hypothetical protein